MPAPEHPDRKIFKKTDLPGETGLSIAQIETLIGRGEFPRPVLLTERRIGWFSDEVSQWREDKRRARDAKLAAGDMGRPERPLFQGRVAKQADENA